MTCPKIEEIIRINCEAFIFKHPGTELSQWDVFFENFEKIECIRGQNGKRFTFGKAVYALFD